MKKPKPRYLSAGAAEVHQLPPAMIGKATAARRRRSLRRCVQHHLVTFGLYKHQPGKWKYTEGEARARCTACGNDLFVGVTLTETTATVAHGCMQGLEDCQLGGNKPKRDYRPLHSRSDKRHS